MNILTTEKVDKKVRRLSYEILEQNIDQDELYLIGFNTTGNKFAQKIAKTLEELSEKKIHLQHLKISPSHPLSSEITLDIDKEKLNGKVLILIDDVANSGRTLFYACKAIMDVLPKKVETAVLVNRRHKAFPIKVNYVGLSLATTLKENIEVVVDEQGAFTAELN